MSVVLLSRLSYCHAQKRPFLPPIQKSGSYPTCGSESDCGASWSECGGIGIGRKVPLTEQYRSRKYEMPASHSAVRRTLAGRGEPRTPSQKSHKERSVQFAVPMTSMSGYTERLNGTSCPSVISFSGRHLTRKSSWLTDWTRSPNSRKLSGGISIR